MSDSTTATSVITGTKGEKSRHQRELEKLRSENQRLSSENMRLTNLANSLQESKSQSGSGFVRRAAAVLLTLLAVALLFIGNLFFWAGNTLVKTDRYVEATAPLIKDPEIQKALSTYTTTQLYTNFDVEKFTADALPPRADFLAPTLATRVRQYTDDVISKLLAKPEFQEKWNTAQANAHARLISSVRKNGSDGSIDLGEFYSQVSQGLKSTKLAFLADKQLPAKVGSIQLVEGRWISRLETVINNIDTWRIVALISLLILTVGGVWFSRNRRRAVARLGLLFAGTMFVTLILIRIAKAIVGGKVDPQYSTAVGHAAGTILGPLVTQTRTILALGLIVAFIAWIGGPSKTAALLLAKLQLLFGGKLHGAIFSHENRLTLFVGHHKRVLQWIAVAAALISLLFIRLTPGALLAGGLILLLVAAILEVVGAPASYSEFELESNSPAAG